MRRKKNNKATDSFNTNIKENREKICQCTATVREDNNNQHYFENQHNLILSVNRIFNRTKEIFMQPKTNNKPTTNNTERRIFNKIHNASNSKRVN